jgi:uncharacterized protein YbaR (Trm112 family)
MHLSLSDLVTCPRCGPTHGLVLLPASVRERRVTSGVLGCANCRARYPIDAGVADLRLAGAVAGERVAAAVALDTSSESESDTAVRLGALLGLAEARGPVLLAGPVASHAAALAGLLEEVEVVVLVVEEDGPPSRVVGAAGVTCMLTDGAIPFRGGSLAGAAVTGRATALAEDALRAVRPTARVLLDPMAEELEARTAAAGGATVLSDGSILVVARRT